MHASDTARFERRLYLFTFVRAIWFYLPVLVHHIVGELRAAGTEQPHTLAMSTLVIFSIGMLMAEYPSGVFADWAGRKRALALSCVFNIAAASLYAVSSSLIALFAGQFIFGLSSAFRSGSDSALLHSHLERAGVPEHYRVALARLRMASNSGIVIGCFTGGFLYAWWPPSVFVGTALFSLVALVLLYGLEEPPRPTVHGNYLGVLRASLVQVRDHPAVRDSCCSAASGRPSFSFCSGPCSPTWWKLARQSSAMALSSAPPLCCQPSR
ncbi:MFS transporter [Candidatus Entotheonella palauensis]|uniref:MFS transporter n=1 Tax=Candidatus Entotheonella palauensis TaxID=93172 RepID=UPI000B7D46CF|nr:MFS transporter [Candidatus Entotheonella palauensis]